MTKIKKPPVLIVDDDSMLRSMLRTILRSEEFEIVGEGSTGEQAIALCHKLHPGLVLLDINMPGMDGLVALQGIKQSHPAIKVIMISAESSLDKVKEAVAKGANGFITKPFKPGRVLDDIYGCISGGKA